MGDAGQIALQEIQLSHFFQPFLPEDTEGLGKLGRKAAPAFGGRSLSRVCAMRGVKTNKGSSLVPRQAREKHSGHFQKDHASPSLEAKEMDLPAEDDTTPPPPAL